MKLLADLSTDGRVDSDRTERFLLRDLKACGQVLRESKARDYNNSDISPTGYSIGNRSS